MTARERRGVLSIYNVVEITDESPEFVIEEVQSIIDEATLDLPDEGPSSENILLLIKLQAYYSNQYSYLVGLFGTMRIAASRETPHRTAMRDYLEKAASACGKKYEGASRILTDYQTIRNENRGPRTL